jgi:hypothetical protein
MKFYTKYKVKIVFKSGYIHVGWVWKFEGDKKENKITSLTWKSAENKSNFNYMHLESIESIVTLAEKKVFRFKNPLN